MRTARIRCALILVAALLGPPLVASSVAVAQPAARSAAQAAAQPAAAAASETPKDALGRETPRGTLLGFMTAARRGNLELAAQYLNTPLRDKAAGELASQLFLVLDARLPARVQDVSDEPTGSLANPLKPDQDVIGTIDTESGRLDILVERVTRGSNAPVWLFARGTLDDVPAVYDEVHLIALDRFLPAFLIRPHTGGIRLIDWLVFFIGLPLLYGLFGLFRPFVRIPGPARLIILAVILRWLVHGLDQPLIARQFWTSTTAMLFVSGVVWIGLMLMRVGESYALKRVQRSMHGDAKSLLRLARHTADVIVVSAGGLTVLRYFGIDATAALAGLGIGGIAVALSAQKTLENVIGGLSIIFDEAVRVGDFIKVGTNSGTVEYVGLRSTRIRTMDRTLLTIPNGQIATLNIETTAGRDKYWFHHFIGLTYSTTAEHLRAIVAEIREKLLKHPRADDSSIRVRVVRFAPSSIDVEISVYLFARDWDNFLELQEELLLDIMGVIDRNGSSIAFPTQTIQMAPSESLLDR